MEVISSLLQLDTEQRVQVGLLTRWQLAQVPCVSFLCPCHEDNFKTWGDIIFLAHTFRLLGAGGGGGAAGL